MPADCIPRIGHWGSRLNSGCFRSWVGEQRHNLHESVADGQQDLSSKQGLRGEKTISLTVVSLPIIQSELSVSLFDRRVPGEPHQASRLIIC